MIKYKGYRQRWRVGPVCKTGASGFVGSSPTAPTLRLLDLHRPSTTKVA